MGEKKRRKVFTIRGVKHWPKLPSEEADVPSMETLKGRLDSALSSLTYWKMSLLIAGDELDGPSHTQPQCPL